MGRRVERHLQRLIEADTEYAVWMTAYRGIWDPLDLAGFLAMREQIESALEETDINELNAD
jgi:hypothetical protein